jgi:hypothetical protein
MSEDRTKFIEYLAVGVGWVVKRLGEYGRDE